MKYQIKKFPEDFYVVESLVLPITQNESNEYYYYTLAKKNLSTFDAIRILSKVFNFDTKRIGYAGLKDEDGVTMQTISSPTRLFTETSISFDSEALEIADSYMKLHYIGGGNVEIKIGKLSGNTFRIIIRGLNTELQNHFSDRPKFTDYFINYYGPQRFGLPNEEKNTHIIGKFLTEEDYCSARNLLSNQQSFIGKQAKEHTSSAEDFFKCIIDERQRAFFINAYESYAWNRELMGIIARDFKSSYISILNSGLDYQYLINRRDLIKLLNQNSEILYRKTFYSNNEKQEVQNIRNTVIQVDILCNRVFTDNDGLKCCELSFFLPSGSYATMALEQILYSIHAKSDEERTYEAVSY
jgi:tRNA pseudouridine13 synthase